MPPKILHILLGVGILAGFFPLLTLKPVAAAGQTTLLPAADAYIDCSNPSINYGTRTTLRVDGSPIVRSYLRFDLSAVVGSISQAKLRIYANSASTSGISVAPVTGAWSETVTTCANAPTPGAFYSTSGAVNALAWKEIDVTGLVRAGGSVSLALGTPGSTAISLASRESGGNAPQLVLTLASPTQTLTSPPPSATSSTTATLPATATLLPPTPTVTPTAAVNTLSFSPEADAYMDSSLPTTNYGRGLAIRVDGSPTVRSYLRFRVTGAGLPITRALLRVYANSASSSGISLFPVSDTTWSETGVTFANAPLPGSQAALSSAVAAGTWKILDVTSLVSGDGLFSFALGTPGSTAISLASRESGANAPQLVLTFPAPAVLLAAGDIAKCGGGTSTPAPGSGAQITFDILLNESGSLFTLGDNSNDSGSLDEYINCFGPTWGRLKDRLTPAMGNHDIIADNQGGPYFSYFGAPAHPESFGHFSLDLGAWHIVVLNAECAVGGQGCEAGSPQETWLRADLAAHPGKCILAIWHQPLFTSGTQSGYTEMRAFWQALYDYHADIILNGHNHNYERFAPQDPFANSDPANGVREFVVGTGGASLDASSFPLAANEEVRSTAAYGYLKLSLYPGSYTWQFIPQPGSIFTDSGSSTCHQGS